MTTFFEAFMKWNDPLPINRLIYDVEMRISSECSADIVRKAKNEMENSKLLAIRFHVSNETHEKSLR